MKTHIVALTEPSDAHLALVQAYLDQSIIVISPRSVLSGDELSLEILRNGRTRVSFKGYELCPSGIWYRKPKPYSLEELPVPDNFKVYTEEVQQYHYKLLRDAFPKAVWASDVYAIQRMNNKLLQLRLAKACGFRVPQTLFTSNDQKARAFIDKYETCIAKVEASQFPKVNGKQTYFFAKRVNKEAIPDFSGLHLAPAIFQECIDAVYDVRVAVVGTQAFGSMITNKNLSESDVRDWRIGHSEETIHFEALRLPRDIIDKCVTFTKQASLMFGAFDFVVDRKGKYWFIEDNPNGQWGFVEEPTRQAIARAMAQLLQNKKHQL